MDEEPRGRSGPDVGADPGRSKDAASAFDDEAALRDIRARTGSRSPDDMYQAALYVYRAIYVAKKYGRGTGRTQQDLADLLGVSEPYLTRLKRLGRALVVHKVPRNSALYPKLAFHANDREIARALDSDTPVDHATLAHLVAARSAGGPGASAAARARDGLSAVSAALPHLTPSEVAEVRQQLQRLLVDMEAATQPNASPSDGTLLGG